MLWWKENTPEPPPVDLVGHAEERIAELRKTIAELPAPAQRLQLTPIVGPGDDVLERLQYLNGLLEGWKTALADHSGLEICTVCGGSGNVPCGCSAECRRCGNTGEILCAHCFGEGEA